jgi:hypothetical protein
MGIEDSNNEPQAQIRLPKERADRLCCASNRPAWQKSGCSGLQSILMDRQERRYHAQKLMIIAQELVDLVAEL